MPTASTQAVRGRALLYLSQDSCRRSATDLRLPGLHGVVRRPAHPGPARGRRRRRRSRNAFVTGFLDLGIGDPKGAVDLRFIDDLVTQISARIERPTPYRSPFGALFSVGKIDESSAGYFLSEDRRLLFILTRPRTEEGTFTGNRAAIEAVRQTVKSLRTGFPAVRVGVTGKPALASDEMTAAFHDSEVAGALSFALTLVLLLLAFVRPLKPIVMLTVLAVSMSWAMGVATLVIGHLTLFSVMFISIVPGIGIDYGIYFLFRYEEELFLGRNLREALQTTARRSGARDAHGRPHRRRHVLRAHAHGVPRPAGARLHLRGRDPPRVDRDDDGVPRHRDDHRPPAPRPAWGERCRAPWRSSKCACRSSRHIAGHRKIVLTLACVLSVLALWGASRVRFDYNLLNLQARGTESVVWEKKILATVRPLRVRRDGQRRHAGRAAHQAGGIPPLKTVSEVDSALLLIPDQQAEKRKIIADFAPIVAPVRLGPMTPLDFDRLITALETLQAPLHHRRRRGAARRHPAPADPRPPRTSAASSSSCARPTATRPWPR
jgi:hypothetical protein